MIKQKIEEIEKGCGKETLNLNGEVVEICKAIPKGVFIEQAQPLTIEGIRKICKAPRLDFKLCSTCQAKLSAFKEALALQEETNLESYQKGLDYRKEKLAERRNEEIKFLGKILGQNVGWADRNEEVLQATRKEMIENRSEEIRFLEKCKNYHPDDWHDVCILRLQALKLEGEEK